jgi:isocitrate/isopropylmalate dehydrogenase
MAKAQEVDAVLLGAVGGPKYDVLDFSVKPERGLLRLRKEMDLYANLRPAQCFDALADFSSLKKDVVAGLDIMIIRELTSGVYFGEPRGIIRRATSASASTPSATPKARSPAWRARPSSWRGSATTRSARWRRPT